MGNITKDGTNQKIALLQNLLIFFLKFYSIRELRIKKVNEEKNEVQKLKQKIEELEHKLQSSKMVEPKII